MGISEYQCHAAHHAHHFLGNRLDLLAEFTIKIFIKQTVLATSISLKMEEASCYVLMPDWIRAPWTTCVR